MQSERHGDLEDQMSVAIARDLPYVVTGTETAGSAHVAGVGTIDTSAGRGAVTGSESVVRKGKSSNELPVVRAGIETSSATQTHIDQLALAATPARVAVLHDGASDHAPGLQYVEEQNALETVVDAETEVVALLALTGTYLAVQLLPLLARQRRMRKLHVDVLEMMRMTPRRSHANRLPGSGTIVTGRLPPVHRSHAFGTNETVHPPVHASVIGVQTAEDHAMKSESAAVSA